MSASPNEFLVLQPVDFLFAHTLYPNDLQNGNFGCAKTPDLIDCHRIHPNTETVTIDQSREFSHQLDSNSSGHAGISPERSKHVFLAALLATSREGYLSLLIDETRVFPSFGELDEEIRRGAHVLPEKVISEGNRYYLYRNWLCEKQFIEQYRRLAHQAVEPMDAPPTLEGEQKEAVQRALSQSLTIISGGPGTGKSFTAAQLVRHLLAQGKEIAVAAPTGKASAHLGQAIGAPCTVKTLQALVAKGAVLPFDLVVVDEASMIDAALMVKLFAAIKEGGRLILLGDRDQLPPVDAGHFFADLSQTEHCVFLERCHRAELHEIVQQAQAVRQGKPIAYSPLESVSNLVKKMKERLPLLEKECLDEAYQCFRLLSPLRQGPYGVDHLNALLLAEHEKLGNFPRPIMITENRGPFVNGQTGFLMGETALFSGKKYSRYQLPKYEYAYVLSVHKSQGSEYGEVWVILPAPSVRFGKEMLYTAITRARRKVEVFAAEGVMERIVQTKRCLGEVLR